MSVTVSVPPVSSTVDYLRALVRAYARTPDVSSVAVIGNAPLEPSAERAAAIDACDVVFRCNSFVLDTPPRAAAAGRPGRRGGVQPGGPNTHIG